MTLSETTRIGIRNTVSLLLTGAISFGSGMLLVMQEGKMPTTVQLWCAGLTAAVLMGNDLKSRLTPTKREG
jgi:hypothetical protein